MRLKLFYFNIILAWATANSQIIVTPVTDTAIYNVANYIQAGNIQQQASNGIYTATYNNITNPSYQMKKLYMDNAGTKQLAKQFYFNGKLNGPFESYQMDKLLAKGSYKEGKLDGDRITYWGNGSTIMEKATYTDGRRSGVWEWYKTDGRLRRRVTYNDNGIIILDLQF